MYVLSFFRPRNSCSTELLGNPRHCRGGDVGGGGGYVHPWWLMDRNNREHHQSRHLNCAAETLVRRGLIPYCCSKIAQFVFLSKKKKQSHQLGTQIYLWCFELISLTSIFPLVYILPIKLCHFTRAAPSRMHVGCHLPAKWSFFPRRGKLRRNNIVSNWMAPAVCFWWPLWSTPGMDNSTTNFKFTNQL